MKKIAIEHTWQDDEFGTIYLTVNPRCKRLYARCFEKGLLLTVPPAYSLPLVLSVVDKMRPQIRKMMDRHQQRQQNKPMIDWNFQLQTDSFQFQVKPSDDDQFYIHHEKCQEAWMLCPANTNFASCQPSLVKAIEECIRKHAKEYFPGLLRQLVHQHQFSVSGLQIKKMKTRWGSCSSAKEIHISLYVMLLPLHLQKLILLHELCHTVHMNHGPKFHALLDKVTGGNEAQWNAELKQYKADIFSFV